LTFSSTDFAHSAVRRIFDHRAEDKPSSRRRSISFDDFETVATDAGPNAPSILPRESSFSFRDEEFDLLTMVREFTRTNDASLAARIENLTGYPLLPEFPAEATPKKSVRPVKELATLTESQIARMQPMVASMRKTRAEEKFRIEQGARVIINSPAKGKRYIQYTCRETGVVLDPGVYESRYRALEKLERRESHHEERRGVEKAKKVLLSALQDEEQSLHKKLDEAIDFYVERKSLLERDFKVKFPDAALPVSGIGALPRSRTNR
jgi:hypothetical protein